MNLTPYIFHCLPILFCGFTTYSVSAEPVNGGEFTLGVIEVLGEENHDWSDPIQTTLTHDDFMRFNRTDVGSAASLLPGVTIQKSGSRSESLLFVRGFNSRQVPVYLDGVPVYVPYDGNIDLARLTTFDLSEISISKGFTSVLYGANTLGGSINLVSRKPAESFELEIGGGLEFDDDADLARYNTYLNAGSNQSSWYWQASASTQDRNFYSLPGDFTPNGTENGGRRDNAESQDSKFSLKVGLTPNARNEYAISYQNQQGEKQTPPYAGNAIGVRSRFWQWPEYDKESLYFIARKGLGETEHALLRVYYDSFKNTLRSYDDDTYSSQFRGYAFNSVYDDYSWGASLELGTLAFDGHDIRAAINLKTDIHREIDDTNAPQERYEDRLLSFGLEDQFQLTDQLQLIGGISYDTLRGQQADDATTNFPLNSENALNLQSGVIYQINKDLRATASISRRSRFPTIKDRYSFRFGSALPNPDLAPERATNIELGLDGSKTFTQSNMKLHWGMSVFHYDITDAIENVTIPASACNSPPCFQLQNIGEQTNNGVEALLTAYLGEHWEFHINYTYLDRDNKSDPDILPLDTPQNSLFSYVSFTANDQWRFQLSGEYNDDRYSTTDGVQVADGFFIGNAKTTWTPDEHLQFELGVNNIADKLYAYDEGFYEAGRSYFINARYRY